MSAGKRRAAVARHLAIIGGCAGIWPGVFKVHGAERKPLKERIHEDLFAACATAIASGYLTRKGLRSALGFYVNDLGYLRNCRPGAPRIGLNGTPCGIVTVEQAKHAADLRSLIRVIRQSKEKAPAAHPKGAEASNPRTITNASKYRIESGQARPL